jgi:hypothetical protein
MERGTKRNAVQWSFVPWLEVFVFCQVPFPSLMNNKAVGGTAK